MSTRSGIALRGGLLFDGSGRVPRRADVLVRGDRVAAVGDIEHATETINAEGLCIVPGFIDMHTHCDLTIFQNPAALHSLLQGVTTEVVGNCGFSAAPIPVDRVDEIGRYVEGFSTRLSTPYSFGEYVDVIRTTGTAVNVVALVGHGVLRIGAMGSEGRLAEGDEIDKMCAALRECLEAGAAGLSLGLAYPPGSFAGGVELRRLAREVARRGALLAVHLRSEGAELLSALEEALSIANDEGARLQISHLKVVGVANTGVVSQALERIETARADGLPVHADFYPYTAGSTYLTQLLPPELHRAGARALVSELRRPSTRESLRRSLRPGAGGWSDLGQTYGGWSGVVLARTNTPALRALEGKSLKEIAEMRSVDEVEALCDVIVEDDARTVAIFFLVAEVDVQRVWADRRVAIGSDTLGVTSSSERVHPRAYGTFAKLLANAAPGGHASLAEAVRRMTSLPAQILGLHDRGVLKPQAAADLVILDPREVRDHATYDQPTRYATGIRHVLVNGQVAVRDGNPTGALAGRPLLRETG